MSTFEKRRNEAADAFFKKVDKQDSCWVWMGNKNQKGYANFFFRGKRYTGSRWIYEHTFGEFKKSLLVCHKCDNPPCVNPNHLFLGTARDNIRDCVRKGRHPETLKTHCVNGHLFSSQNTYITPKGHRKCRECCHAYLIQWRRTKSSAIWRERTGK